MYNVILVKGIKCTFDDSKVIITGSYRIPCDEIPSFCNELKIRTGLKHWRSMDSWIKALTVNIWLYNKNIDRWMTQDTILNDKESWIGLLRIDFLYAMYKIEHFLKCI